MGYVIFPLPSFDIFIQDHEEEDEANGDNNVAHTCEDGQRFGKVFTEDLTNAVESEKSDGPGCTRVINPKECGEAPIFIDSEYKGEDKEQEVHCHTENKRVGVHHRQLSGAFKIVGSGEFAIKYSGDEPDGQPNGGSNIQLPHSPKASNGLL